MKHVLSASLLFALTSAATFAGSTNTSVIAVPSDSQRATATALVQSADYLCVTVAINSREKTVTTQSDDVRETLKQLSTAVEKQPRLQIHQGPLRFFGGAMNGPGSPRMFPFSSMNSGGPAQLNSSVRILCKLGGSEGDALNASTFVRQLVETIKPAGQSEVRVVGVSLAVESPERQRERLLQLIHDSADAMKKTFGADRVTIGGLEGPVLVRQVDDEQVELFINYELSVSAGK